MVTAKPRDGGGNSERLARGHRFPLYTLRLVLVLAADALLCIAALAQPASSGRRESTGPSRPAAARPEAVEAEPAEEAAPPEKNYEELPVDENLKKDSLKVNPILMAGKFGPGEKELFDQYYEKYFLARWTQVKNIANLPAWRKELRTSHLGKKSAATEVHDHLSALVLEFMKKLAGGAYHPAVQVNAMLMIGELNSAEQPQALEVLIAAVQNTKSPDGVRAAAMVGIQRCVAAKLSDAEARRSLSAAVLHVAADDLPPGANRAGREWILGQSLETLGLLGSVGENNAVFTTILKTVSDAKLSLRTRNIAAESLGRLNYSGAAGIDAAETAAALGQFVIDVCAEELRRAKDTGYPVSRRRMQQCLDAVLAALEKVGPLASTPSQQAFLGDLKTNTEKMSDQIGKWHEGDNLEAPIGQLQSNLEAWLKKKPT
jgi:hypothetical protein